MSVFSRRIFVNEVGNLEFHFNRIFTVDGTRYFIMVVDRGHNILHFKMEQTENGSWVIEKNKDLPSWIVELEQELDEAIKKH